MSIKVYLAGGWLENEDDWRYDLVKGLKGREQPLQDSGLGFRHWGAISNAILGCIDYVGPYPDPDQEVHRIREAIRAADLVFIWTQPLTYLSELAKVGFELGFAAALDKRVAVATPSATDDTYGNIWVADQGSSFYPFSFEADNPKDAMIDCFHSLMRFLPMETIMDMRKSNPSARALCGDYLSNAGYVYVIKADTGHCKIGRTNNVPNRMKLFSVKLPFEFEIISYFPCDDMYQTERWLHGVYADKRANGEWFSLPDEDIELLKLISYVDQYEPCNKDGVPIQLEEITSEPGKPWYTDEEFAQLIRC